MSERTNTDVVQQGYEAFGRGDIPALLQFLTVDVEWTQQGPSVVPFSGTRSMRTSTLSSSSLASSSRKTTRSSCWVWNVVS